MKSSEQIRSLSIGRLAFAFGVDEQKARQLLRLNPRPDFNELVSAAAVASLVKRRPRFGNLVTELMEMTA